MKDYITNLTVKIYRTTLLFPKKEPLRYKIREAADEILANFTVWELYNNPNPLKSLDFAEKEKQDKLVFNIKKNLEILGSYFEIAKWQNWVSYFDILDIEKDYKKLDLKITNNIEEKNLKTSISSALAEPAAFGSNIGKKKQEKEAKERKSDEEREKTDKEEKKPEEVKVFLGKNNKIMEPKPEIDKRKKKILEILKERGKIQVGEANKILSKVSKRTLRRDFVQLLERGLIERMGKRNDTFYKLRPLTHNVKQNRQE